ncbi:MAG TPA: membrane protein insertase YidC [Actinocrinis sp.]|uniref:membrane protein insertase YidC n=1 Tax=Actinocrinis sp. TaxID=1920516 RepID=UPI002DDD8BE1|nr:membrane protein insertase YidC [Actinocrinis sp.]HEV2343789.1 membrane protein insertase YidC [Actinocrinis sp.]
MQWYDQLLSPLIWGVSWVIVQFHKLFGAVFIPNSGWAWGLSIVCMTLVIRAALIPLFVKQIKSMRAMQVVQPEMKKLQEKYKKELERARLDPVKKREIQGRQQREMMALYKEHGTNPFASCLPLLVQMPFFTALYRLLYNVANGTSLYFMSKELVASAKQAHIFGAPISAHFNTPAKQLLGANTGTVRGVIIAMTVIYVVTQFITQWQMIMKNSAPDNPMVQQQKMMLYVMPVMMAFFCFIAPVGVLIYLLTTNFWTMGQQFYVLHNSPLPGSKAHEAHLIREAAKAAKKAAKSGAPVDATVDVPSPAANRVGSKSAGARTTANGSATKVATGAAAGATQIEDARPKQQRSQPVRTTRSGRKK